MTCGIYKIINKINNNTYVGQSVNIEKRLYEHKRTLIKQLHKNPHLQNAWNKYGSDAFEFSIIEICEKDQLTILEQFHADTLKAQNVTLYNHGLYTVSPRQGVTHTNETKTKISIALKGKYVGQNNALFGTKRSKEVCMNMSNARKGTYIGINNPYFGKHHSDDTKTKIASHFVGEKSLHAKLTWAKVDEIRILLNDGVPIIKIAALYNVHPTTISDIKFNRTWKEQNHK